MAQTQLNVKELNGFNIYHTKNQVIYWDKFSKTAYIISQSDVNKFSTWQLRLPLALMFSMIMVLLNFTYIAAFVAGFAAYTGANIVFHVSYLPNLPVSLRWQKPQSEGFIKDTSKQFNFTSLVFVSIMSVVFIIMFIIDAVVYKDNQSTFIIYVVLAVIALVGAIITALMAKNRKALDKASKAEQSK